MTSWDYFWNIASPIIVAVGVIEVLLSVFLFWKSRPVFIIFCSVITFVISFLALMSVGVYIFFIAIIQLAEALFLMLKKVKCQEIERSLRQSFGRKETYPAGVVATVC